MSTIATARRATHQLHAVYSVGKRKYHKCERCGREHEVQATRKPTICRDCRSVDPNWGKQ